MRKPSKTAKSKAKKPKAKEKSKSKPKKVSRKAARPVQIEYRSTLSDSPMIFGDIYPAEKFEGLMVRYVGEPLKNAAKFKIKQELLFGFVLGTDASKEKILVQTQYGFLGWLAIDEYQIMNYFVPENHETIH